MLFLLDLVLLVSASESSSTCSREDSASLLQLSRRKLVEHGHAHVWETTTVEEKLLKAHDMQAPRGVSGDEARTCTSGYVVSGVATALFLVLCGKWILSGLYSETVVGARRCVYFFSFAWTVIFSMAIPNAMKLAKRAGGDATTSGWIIGSLMFGYGTGNLLVWVTNASIVDGTLKAMRGFSLLGGAAALLGTSAFALLAWFDPLPWSLCAARCVAGFGLGVSTSAGRHFVSRTARGREIRDVSTTTSLAIAVGLGFGPLLQAALNEAFAAVCGGQHAPVGQGAEYLGMVEFGLFLVVAAWIFPTTEELARNGRIPKQSKMVQRECSFKQYPEALPIVGCLIICSIRGFSMSSLESAIAMLLEEKFGLTESAVGLLISFTFLFTVPLKSACDRAGAGSNATSLRVFMFVCVLGCVLLRDDVGQFLGGGSNRGRITILILATMLLFPAIWLTGAVVEALAFRLASPEGTLLSTNNVIALYNVLANLVGRGLGPPIARSVLSSASGQTGYSWQQLAVSSATVVLLELTVVGRLHNLDEEFTEDILTGSSSGELIQEAPVSKDNATKP